MTCSAHINVPLWERGWTVVLGETPDHTFVFKQTVGLAISIRSWWVLFSGPFPLRTRPPGQTFQAYLSWSAQYCILKKMPIKRKSGSSTVPFIFSFTVKLLILALSHINSSEGGMKISNRSQPETLGKGVRVHRAVPGHCVVVGRDRLHCCIYTVYIPGHISLG